MKLYCAWSSFLQNWDRRIINKMYYYYMNVCVHVRARVHVCACACVRACVRACGRACMHVRARASPRKPQNHGQKTQRPKPQTTETAGRQQKPKPKKNTNRRRATTYAYVDRRNLVSGVRRPTVRDVATH